jgi:hypothetical protein
MLLVAFRLSSASRQLRIVSSAPKIEPIVSSATDISTADAARVAGACASVYACSQGMEAMSHCQNLQKTGIIFDQPVSLSTTQPVEVATGNRDQTQSSMMQQ